MPLVSCVIPVYNSTKYLPQALESVFRQTYQELEVLIVDDGSTDSLLDVLKPFEGRFRLICQSNQGTAAARNKGILAAKGELIAFLDSDDLWEKTKIAKQVAEFENDSTIQYCVHQMKNFISEDVKDFEKVKRTPRLFDVFPAFLPLCLMARKEIIRENLFNPFRSFTEDVDWFLRMHDYGIKYICIDEILAFRRIHENNRTNDRMVESNRGLLKTIYESVLRKKNGAK